LFGYARKKLRPIKPRVKTFITVKATSREIIAEPNLIRIFRPIKNRRAAKPEPSPTAPKIAYLRTNGGHTRFTGKSRVSTAPTTEVNNTDTNTLPSRVSTKLPSPKSDLRMLIAVTVIA
jgi:hypothetical protein